MIAVCLVACVIAALPHDAHTAGPAKRGQTAKTSSNDISARWVGRKVWILGAAAYSGPNFNDPESEVWDPELPATIEAIKRIEVKNPYFGFSPEWANGWGPAGFESQTPLLVTLKLPPMDVHRSPSGCGPTGPYYVPPMPGVQNDFSQNPPDKLHPAPKEGWMLVPDEKALRRLVRLDPPDQVLQRCSAYVRTAFRQRQVVKGMPRELVVRLLDYPYRSESPEKTNRRSSWSYGAFGGFSYEVRFDRHGRVKKAWMAGSLP